MFHPLAQSESGNKKTALKRFSETQSHRKLFASLMIFVIVCCQHLLFYLPDIAILADDQTRVKAARAAELWKTRIWILRSVLGDLPRVCPRGTHRGLTSTITLGI